MDTPHMSLSDAVARTVASLLAERRVDVKAFAASVAHTSQSTVYRQLAGETKINSDQLEYLADALDMDPAELVSRAMKLRSRMQGSGTSAIAVRGVRAQRIVADEPTTAKPDQQ